MACAAPLRALSCGSRRALDSDVTDSVLDAAVRQWLRRGEVSDHLSTATMRGPTLSPVALLCATCAPLHSGKVSLFQQRQYTFLSPAGVAQRHVSECGAGACVQTRGSVSRRQRRAAWL